MEKNDIQHNLHVVLAFYVMLGGFIHGTSNIYTLLMSIIITGWIIFNGCVLNRGYNYPKASISEQIFKDVGINNGFNIFSIITISGFIYSKNILLIILYSLYELSKWLRSDPSDRSIEDAKSQ